MTKLLYLEDFNLLSCAAKVVEVFKENDRDIVILDQTVFYPQGGGQPYDKGTIESTNVKFIVEEVRFLDGLVRHIGSFENGILSQGDAVKCQVDEERRNLNSRLHSGGHLVDMAVHELKADWVPGKGFHFPEGPYVEYSGSLEGVDVEKLKSELENLCNQFIGEGKETKLEFMDKEQMEGKPARVVFFGDSPTGGAGFGVPCGGTHVSNISGIGSLTIRKIKNDGGNIRVGYDVVR